MTNITIKNGSNTQSIIITAKDNAGGVVSAATLAGALYRNNVALTGGGLTFTPVSGTPGAYSAILSGFDAPAGPAWLIITGTNGSVTVKEFIYTTISENQL